MSDSGNYYKTNAYRGECVGITFRLNSKSHDVETKGVKNKIEPGGMSSLKKIFYDILESVVQRYFEVVRKNQALKNNVTYQS